jgi:hypothetical protein
MPSAAKNSERRMTIALVLVVVAAIAIALVTARASRGATAVSAEPSLLTSSALDTPMKTADAEPEAALGGEVLETIPVSKYTYLRLRSTGGEIWAAVPSADVAIGSHVTIANATLMDDFKSATLNRSFKVIYFGSLEGSVTDSASEPSSPKFPMWGDTELDSDQELPPGHPNIGSPGSSDSSPDSRGLPNGHPEIGPSGTVEASPHGGLGVSNGGSRDAPLSMPKIVRAFGSRPIAELVVARRQLDGKRVRVRGQVTKVTPDVRGRAFYHLRDSDKSDEGAPNDLVVTSVTVPERGQVVTLEGTLRADHDIGSGYRYPVLLEDARVIDP